MTARAKRAAITGAYGYLGGLIRQELDARGWDTVALVRRPRADDPSARHYDLAEPVDGGLLEGFDLLVHCAYDLTLVRRDDVWRVNVDGSRRLLVAAREAGVGRTIVLSSMSAYDGTAQLYGRAKLAIEAATAAAGGCAVRPGLVYGDRPGGMAGSLVALTRLPLTPIIGGRAHQFLVHEDDLAGAVAGLAECDQLPPGPISIAAPTPVPFRAVVERFARDAGNRPRFVPVPWRLVYWALRTGELLRVPLPFRSDSLLGLVRPAPSALNVDRLRTIGIPRPFDPVGAP